MRSTELFKLTGKDKDIPLAYKWSYHKKPREVFYVKRSKIYDSDPIPPVNRFEVVKTLSGNSWEGRQELFGVVTTVTDISRLTWRVDLRVSVKMFENILDAIEYSEKKKAKYESKRKQLLTGI